MSKKPLLDIIVTHCDEPWETGKKLFDLIQYQQCVSLDQITVTVVQDGKDNALAWNDLLGGYSFKPRVVTLLNHMGIAEARNAGIDHTSSEWFMFCDWDDMFSDVSSLKMILELLPTSEYDVLHGNYCQFEETQSKYFYINKVCGNMCTIHNKLYRREFILKKGLRFNPKLEYHCEFVFNSIILAETPSFRIGSIKTEFITYFKTFNPDGVLSREENYIHFIDTLFLRDVTLAQEMKKRGKTHAYKTQIVKTLYDAYFCITEASHCQAQDFPEVLDFFRKHETEFYNMSLSSREVIMENAQTEMLSYIQHMFNYFDRGYTFVYDHITFDEWINAVREGQEPVKKRPETVEQVSALPIPQVPENAPPVQRVAVWCGTSNTYVNMSASAKSLLSNTVVDKCYFIIEDDTFPEQLPDMIETINIKTHPLLKYFDTAGPNYDNVWTYMCMVRAVYPKLFPQHEKVLSLDIDTVIQADVSDLFNIDMSDAYLAGVPEPQRSEKPGDSTYINFGVTMMNLDKLASDGIDEQVISDLNNIRRGCPEQDSFNKFCAGHIISLPNDYNVTVYSHITGEPQQEKILHYAGIKYWRHFTPVRQYADLTWTQVMDRQEELKGAMNHE